jgi:hypothetical protein
MATYNSTQYSPHVLKRTTGGHAPASPQVDYGKWRYKFASVLPGINPDDGSAYTELPTDTYDLFELPACRVVWMRVGWGGGALGAATANLSIKSKAYTKVGLDGTQSAVGAETYFSALDAALTITVPYEYYNMATGTFEVFNSTEPVVFEAVVDTAALNGARAFWVDIAYVVE